MKLDKKIIVKVLLKNYIRSFSKQLLFFICFFTYYSVYSQIKDYDITTIPVNTNNFSASAAKKLYIDDKGFLWYSTFNGIVKEMGNGNPLFFEYEVPDKTIYYRTHDIFKTSKNEIWSCTSGGINVLNLESGKSRWISIKYPGTNTDVYFSSIKEDSKGSLWLSTNKNYLFCYTNSNIFLPFRIPQSDYNSRKNNKDGALSTIKTILKNDALIIEQDKKWFLFKDGESQLVFDDSSLFSPSKNTSTLIIDNNSIFPSESSGIYLHNNVIYQYKYIPKIDKQIIQFPYKGAQFIPKSASENFDKNINFVGLEKNKLIALRLERDTDNYKLTTKKEFEIDHIITSLIYDPIGYFWLHSEGGLSRIRYNDVGFKKHLNDMDMAVSCRGFSEDANGNIYIFTYKGIFKLEKGSDSFKEIDTIEDYKTYRFISKYSYNFYKENDSTFWFYGYHNSLIKFNVDQGTFETYKMPYKIQHIIDAERVSLKLMLGTKEGLYSFNLDTKTFSNENAINETINLKGITVLDIKLNKRESSLWLSTTNEEHALIKIDYATNIISSFGPNRKGLQIINNEICIIHEDEKSNLWLGTRNGLEKINPVNYVSKNFNSINGLTNTNIAGILEDDTYLWISTFEGLLKFNKKTESMQTFFEEDGLPHNEFNRKSYFKASDGTLYFGGLNGLVSFNPKKISKNDKVHKLFLSEYEKYDSETEATKKYLNLNSIDEFNISNEQNYITLIFAINDILNPDKNIYQYRIRELFENWTNLVNSNILQLQGLKPGKYTLEVRGFSSNGNQTNVLKYNIDIDQKFYKKTWFIALLILSGFLFFMLRNKLKQRQLLKNYEQKANILRLESKVFLAQMNPHFIFNTLKGLKTITVKKGEAEGTKYFNAFSSLISLTIDMNNSEYIFIEDEIAYLKSYLKLENFRLGNKINIKFNIDENLPVKEKSIPSMLFQPLIKDALINGLIPKKYDLELNINFKLEGNYLIGEIVDNGISREAANLRNKKKRSTKKSDATRIMKERIILYNSLSKESIDYKIMDIKSEGDHLLNKSVLKIPLNDTLKPIIHDLTTTK